LGHGLLCLCHDLVNFLAQDPYSSPR
jgi:hypothetical protein